MAEITTTTTTTTPPSAASAHLSQQRDIVGTPEN